MTTEVLTAPCMLSDRPFRARLAYWLPTSLLALLMLSGGLMDALKTPEAVAVFAQLGYPAYCAGILGWAKVAGAVAILAPVPRTIREWAYAGFTIDVGSAILSLLAVGHPLSSLGIPLFALALVLASYAMWRRREARPLFTRSDG